MPVGMTILLIPVFEKEAIPRLFIVVGNSIDVILEQPLKALSPIDVMPSGIVTLGILAQPLKASLLMVEIEAGMLMLDVNEEAPRNALLPSTVKPAGMLILFLYNS